MFAGRRCREPAARAFIDKTTPGRGLEPRRTAPKAAVLPLDDPGLNGSILTWPSSRSKLSTRPEGSVPSAGWRIRREQLPGAQMHPAGATCDIADTPIGNQFDELHRRDYNARCWGVVYRASGERPSTQSIALGRSLACGASGETNTRQCLCGLALLLRARRGPALTQSTHRMDNRRIPNREHQL